MLFFDFLSFLPLFFFLLLCLCLLLRRRPSLDELELLPLLEDDELLLLLLLELELELREDDRLRDTDRCLPCFLRLDLSFLCRPPPAPCPPPRLCSPERSSCSLARGRWAPASLPPTPSSPAGSHRGRAHRPLPSGSIPQQYPHRPLQLREPKIIASANQTAHFVSTDLKETAFFYHKFGDHYSKYRPAFCLGRFLVLALRTNLFEKWRVVCVSGERRVPGRGGE